MAQTETWLQPKVSRPRPTAGEAEQMWESIEVEALPVDSPAILEFQRLIDESHDNGGCYIGKFYVRGNAAFTLYASGNWWLDIGFFDWFVRHPTFLKAFPDLKKKSETDTKFDLQWGSSFTLDGELASVAFNGGAYTTQGEQFNGSGRKAKELGSQVCDEIFGDRFDEAIVFKTHAAWSDWHWFYVWIHTWFIVDKRNCLIWMITISDTD